MKFVIALATLCLAFVSARPQGEAPVLGEGVKRYVFVVGPEGYDFSLELDDGTTRDESGKFVNDIYNVNGQYAYSAPNGAHVQQSFVANDGGFQPKTKVTL